MKKLSVILSAIMCMLPALALADTFTRSLSVGSRGPEVIKLQETLVSLAFLKTNPTGYFGVLTKAAVISFQKANGLPPVGLVGPKTRALLNAQTAQTSTTSSVTPTSSSTIPSSSSTVSTAATTSAANTAPTASIPTTSSSALTITMISPAPTLPANTAYATLTIATQRPATCRWGTLPNMEYQSMSSFGVTAATTHSHEFSALAPGGWYIYYIKCEDSATLVISPDTTVSFSVAAH
ncbi:peptidoglycan-binding protein [Candidatus Kaiserbacteria bacterium]|nr:peptidoglycan-binding protein [Candidatus Kaiserbacteria bacterium]